MTYVVGFRVGDACFLVADSAVTTSPLITEPAVAAEFSAFNERFVIEQRRAVREGALKIYNLGSAALSGAGDRMLIEEVATKYERFLNSGAQAEDAFRNAVNSMTPLADRAALQVVTIFREQEGGAAKLMSFNIDLDENIRDHGADVVHLGSIDNSHKVLTQSLVELLRAKELNAQQVCALSVGACQSYGIRAVLMEMGVGGAFYGAYTADNVIKWNSDLSYLVYDGTQPENGPGGRAVYTYFRGNTLVSISSFPQTDSSDGKFHLRVTARSNQTTDAEAKIAMEEAIRDVFERIPDYFIFLDQSAPRAVVAEVLGQPDHQNIRVQQLNLEKGIRVIAYRGPLRAAMFDKQIPEGASLFYFERNTGELGGASE